MQNSSTARSSSSRRGSSSGSSSQESALATTNDHLHTTNHATTILSKDSTTAVVIAPTDAAELALTIEEKEEMAEVVKMSQSDTRRVKNWRCTALVALLLTGLGVTIITYKLLKKEESDNFHTAFEQFSRTLGDAAVGQQRDLRDGLATLATALAVYAETNQIEGEKWPFITLPMFELQAEHMRKQAHMETINFLPLVQGSQRAAWIDYANRKHEEWVHEGHYLQNGSLERLVGGEETYHPYLSHRMTDGSFTNESEYDSYFVSWQYSPPPATYDLVNGNLFSVPLFQACGEALLKLGNETLMTPVFPHVGIPTAMTHEEHDKKHSELLDTRSQNPHAFAVHPVHRLLRLPTSNNNSKPNAMAATPNEIVGFLAGASGWDHALLGLLPEGVVGIHTVLQNTCGQSFTYEIRGPDAMYLGPTDLHQHQKDDMEVVVNLALHQNPDFPTTPGHCQYSMHIYPSEEFKSSYDSNTPELFAAAVAITFGLVAIIFFVYDLVVQRRNYNLIVKAAQTNAIIYSLFPNKNNTSSTSYDCVEDTVTFDSQHPCGDGHPEIFLEEGKTVVSI